MPRNNDKIKSSKSRWLKETDRANKNRLKRFMTTSGREVPALVTLRRGGQTFLSDRWPDERQDRQECLSSPGILA
jgi:hypothetical protein